MKHIYTSFDSDWMGCGCCCGDGGPGIPGTLGTTVTGLTSYRQRYGKGSAQGKLVFGIEKAASTMLLHKRTHGAMAGAQSFLISQPHYVGWPVIL